VSAPHDPASIAIPGPAQSPKGAPQSAEAELFPVELHSGPFDGLVLDTLSHHARIRASSPFEPSGFLATHQKLVHTYERTGFQRDRDGLRVLVYQHLDSRFAQSQSNTGEVDPTGP
jgi:hypothetical protein